MPAPESLADDELPGILDQFDTREVMHVTFGSVLRAEENGKPRFKDRFMQTLLENEEVHYDTVARSHRAARAAVCPVGIPKAAAETVPHMSERAVP